MNHLLILTLSAALLLASTASGLELRVRGSSVLDVEAIGAGTLAQVAGTLRDEQGRAIAYRSIQLRIDGPANKIEREITTNARGQFYFQEELSPGTYSVIVDREADAHFDGDLVVQSVLLEPRGFEVSVVGPQTVFGRELPVLVYGQAAAGPIPVQFPALIYVDGERVGSLEMDGSGRGSLDVRDALKEGNNLVEMVLPGSAFREEVRASTQIRYVENPTTSAGMEERVSRLTRGMAIHGKISDTFGPIENLRVQALFLPVLGENDIRRAINVTTRTNSLGEFEAFASGVRLGNGVWLGSARLIPSVGPPVEVEIEPLVVEESRARKITGWLGVFGILIGILFVFQRSALRVRDRWEKWQTAQARQVRDRQALDKHEILVPVFLDAPEEQTSRDDVGGVVWDTWKDRPAGECEIILFRNDRRSEPIKSDKLGRFRMVDVEAGDWEMSISGPGFVTGKMKLRVPHQGRYAAMRIDMVAVPLKIRRLYQTTMEAALGEDPWGSLSPDETDRELRALLSVFDPRDAPSELLEILQSGEELELPALLDVLAQLLEESYFSGRTYPEEVWFAARDMVLRLRRAAGIEGAS